MGRLDLQRRGTFTNQLLVLTSRPQGGVSVLTDLDFHMVIACGTTPPANRD